MNRTLKRWGPFAAAAAALPAVLMPSPAAAADTALLAQPYRAVYLNGETAGTYSISRPTLSILTTLQISGQLTSSGGCYTAQVGVRQSGVWRFTTVASACSSVPVSYQVSSTAVTTLSPAFGVRVCQTGGGCGQVTTLPALPVIS
jgi:hypothetical protein